MHTLTPIIKGQGERLTKEMEDLIVGLDQEHNAMAENVREVLSIAKTAYTS